MSSILDELLGGPVLHSRPLQTGPASPYGIMPRHLAIPNVGGSVPLAGTPVNFPTYTPTNPLAATPAAGRFTPRLLGPTVSSAAKSFSSSPLAKLGRVAKGGGRLARFGPGAIASIAASPVGSLVGGGGADTAGVDRRDAGQALAGALTGAGVGSLGGWPGALAGAVVGGVGNALNVFDVFGGGGDKAVNADPEYIGGALNDALADAGITGKTRDAIKNSTMSQLELATTDAEKQQVLATAEQVIMQQAMAQENSTQQLAHSLALQAQAAQIFEPYAEANQRNADMAKVLFENASQGLPDSQRYLAAQFALGAQQQSDALTQQMMTTAVAQPRLDALVAQQQQIESVAAQLVQRALAGAMEPAGGQGGGGVDMAALLAQAGG